MNAHLDQLCRAMQDATFYPHAVTAVQKEETHISIVFLTGSKVYKIKKPVQLGFLDFSTLDLRRFYCHEEVRLNRRLSRDVYEGVVPITFDNGRYQLDGQGDVVEYAVQMKQLSFQKTLKRLLANDGLAFSNLDRLARLLVEFYENAAGGGAIDAMGQTAVITRICQDNFTQTAQWVGTILNRRVYAKIEQATRGFLRNRATWFDKRIEMQKIRDGHGDLRAGHIYFVQDRIQIIDCIEFNEQFRFLDIVCDLAFLAMDLDHLGHPDAARSLIKAYLRYTDDMSAFNMLAFYKCYRAMVRVKVNCLRLKQLDIDAEREGVITQTRNYLALAGHYAATFGRPVIWVVCGLIATGKSTVANALAQALQIPVYNSDRIRKSMTRESGPVPFEKGLYTRQITGMTYGKLLLFAQQAVMQGGSAALDATYGTRQSRDAVHRLAQHLGARILFVECTCRQSLIRERLKARKYSAPVSDARLEHLEPIQARYEMLQEIDPAHLIRVDTENSLNDIICTILANFA